MLLKEAE
jgi:CspA family cold shock protein